MQNPTLSKQMDRIELFTPKKDTHEEIFATNQKNT